METQKTIFSQIMSFIPRYEFYKFVKQYNGHYKVHTFTCWEQFLCMAFAQLTYRESLRDIEVCLRSLNKKSNHLGIHSKVSKSTLSDANERRNWRIYQNLAFYLIKRASKLYANDSFSCELKNIVYALDSTSIELNVSLFSWAKYGKDHAAVCLHTLLNLRGNIPTVIVITSKLVSELKVLDQLTIEKNAIYIMDRGYIDFSRFYKIHKEEAFFVTRAKTDFKFKRLYSNKIDKNLGIKCDQIIHLKNKNSFTNFPEKLRRIKYKDPETKKQLVFITNNINLSAKTIIDLYRSRWQIELFFKWIKQHLRIKAFYGRSENAVKTQIWIAVSVYVLVAIVKKELKIKLSLYTILQIFSVSIFEKISILKALSQSNYQRTDPNESQMSLF